MALEVAVVWAILALVVVLFLSQRIAPDAAALAGLLALVAVGSLSPEQALAGFSSPAVIAIAALLILGAALERTGVVRWVADVLHGWAGRSERRLLLAGTLAPGLLSGFINIVATVSVFIPVLLRVALKAGTAPARLLLPMAYVAMAGANLTLIGASHNLVVNDILQSRTDSGFGFLEFTPIGIAMLTVITLYVLFTARWLLPTREQQQTQEDPRAQTRALIDTYDFAERVWELEVTDAGAAAERPLRDLQLARDYGLSLIALVREDHNHTPPAQDAVLRPGDILLLGGRRERVEALTAAVAGLELRGAPAHRDDFSAGSAELIEVLVPPRSPVIGKTVRDLDLRKRVDLTALALWRDGAPLRTDAQTTALAAGDAVLLYGDTRYTHGFEPEPDFLWLHAPRRASTPPAARRKGPWVLLIFVLVILSAALDWAPIALAALAGALAVTLLGALSADRAYARIEWRTVILIAAMLPFATALNDSGASDQLAQWLTARLGGWGPLAVLAAVALAAFLLTQALHNAAVAAVMTPVALDCALQLGVNPKTFAVTVLVAASMSVLLPIGHPAPLLVKPYGDYRGGDYLRLGLGAAVLTGAVILLLVPWLWPFDGA